MTAPAYATDLTDIFLDSGGTMTRVGGAPGTVTNPETDFYIQGNSCASLSAWNTATKGLIYTVGSNIYGSIPTDGVLVVWGYYSAAASLAAMSAGGFQIVEGSGTGAYRQYYVAGNDTLIFDSWIPYVVNVKNGLEDTSTGGPTASNTSYVGAAAYLPGAGPTKGAPFGIDALRYGRHTLSYTEGDTGAGGYSTFSGAEAWANAPTRRLGNLELARGVYRVQGFHSLGTGTAVTFKDANKVLLIRNVNKVTSGYNRFEVLNSSSTVEMDNIVIQALGTVSRGLWVTTAGTLTATNCQFVDMDTFSFLSTSTVTDCIFRRTNAITAPGSLLTRTKILNSTVAADASALVWNVATDTDGKLDDMTFSKGTLAHHAIELGASTPADITLRGMTFTGFNASDGQNDSVLYLSDKGTDTAWTITANSCTGTVSYKKARSGDTVTVNYDQVTITIEVRDKSGTLITDATEITLVRTSDLTVLTHAESVTSGSTSYLYEYSGDVTCYVNVLSVDNYVPRTVEPVVLKADDQTLVVQLDDERGRYFNP